MIWIGIGIGFVAGVITILLIVGFGFEWEEN